MKRIIPLLCLMLVVSLNLFALQEPKPEEKKGQDATPMPAPYRIPDEDAKKANPVKYSASSVAEGRRLYDSQCARLTARSPLPSPVSPWHMAHCES